MTVGNSAYSFVIMLAYTSRALAIIAKVYIDATGIPATRVGLRICGNDKLIKDMMKGRDCLTASAQIASDWFDQNWPLHVRWPDEVIRRSGRMVLQSVERVRAPPSKPSYEWRKQRRNKSKTAQKAKSARAAPRAASANRRGRPRITTAPEPALMISLPLPVTPALASNGTRRRRRSPSPEGARAAAVE